MIIGGTSGIGLATARRFYEAGCEVIAAGRTNRLQASDQDIAFLPCDVTSEESVAVAFSSLERRGILLDVLIINSGIAPGDPGKLGSIPAADFDAAFTTNTRGVFLCLNQAPKLMADNGSIILTGTGATNLYFPGYALYSASKSALLNLARHAAAQLGPRGIRVNCISPGTIITPIQPADDPEALICEAHTCLGRMGTTNDVTGAFHFLAANESRYITATELLVDGGWVGGVTEETAKAIMSNASTTQNTG